SASGAQGELAGRAPSLPGTSAKLAPSGAGATAVCDLSAGVASECGTALSTAGSSSGQVTDSIAWRALRYASSISDPDHPSPPTWGWGEGWMSLANSEKSVMMS